MNMIGANVQGMKRPSANLAMAANDLIDDPALVGIENDRLALHPVAHALLQDDVGVLDAATSKANPAAWIAGEPGAVSRPSQKISDRLAHEGSVPRGNGFDKRYPFHLKKWALACAAWGVDAKE